MKEVLGILTVRGGSKGLPRKNVRPLCGKPLMAWTIEQALASKLITRFVVSTEDPEMKKIAEEYGVEVLDRPVELAQDETSSWEVLNDALITLKPYKPDAVILLQAPCPIRKSGLIDHCIEKFFEEDVDSLVTGYICKEVPYGTPIQRRQDIKGFFACDGNVFIMKPETIFKGDLMGKKHGHVFTSKEEHVDIDSEFEFWLAEKIMEERI